MACKIQLTAVEARGLVARDFNGKSDPYIKMEFGGKVFKSSVQKKTLEPRWMEKFIIQTDLEQGISALLTVQVWDYDRWSSDEEMGVAEVELSSLLEEGLSNLDSWWPITLANGNKAGEIRLKVDLLPGSEPIMHHQTKAADPIPPAAAPPQPMPPPSTAAPPEGHHQLAYPHPPPAVPGGYQHPPASGYPPQAAAGYYPQSPAPGGYPSPQAGAPGGAPVPGGYPQQLPYQYMPPGGAVGGGAYYGGHLPYPVGEGGNQDERERRRRRKQKKRDKRKQKKKKENRKNSRKSSSSSSSEGGDETDGDEKEKKKKKKRKNTSSSSLHSSAPSASSSSSSAGGDSSDDSDEQQVQPPEPAVAHAAYAKVKELLPWAPDYAVWSALHQQNYEPEKATNMLLTHPPPPYPNYPQQMHHHAPPPGYPQQPMMPPGYPQQQPYYMAPPPPPTGPSYIVIINQAPAGPPPVPKPTYGLANAPSVSTDLTASRPGVGRRKALLVGINYTGTRQELKGCIKDVENMRDLLVNTYKFRSDVNSMVCLTDDATDKKFKPTRFNIIYGMKWLVADAKKGDVFFFHFSGHGSQVRDKTGMEADGLDEVILPLDHRSAGPIIDDEMHMILCQSLPEGVRLTAVMDCCHSGTGLDLPYNWDVRRRCWEEDENPYLSAGDVQLFAGCSDSQKAADVSCRRGSLAPGGAVTTAFVDCLKANPHGYTYPQLIASLQSKMIAARIPQRPQLSSSQKFNLNRNFNLTDIVPNHNQFLGRKVRRRKRRVKPEHLMVAGGLGLLGAVLIGGLID